MRVWQWLSSTYQRIAGQGRSKTRGEPRQNLRPLMTVFLVVLLLLVAGLTETYLHRLNFVPGAVIQLILVGGFSGLVGFGELISRYKDDPFRLSGSPGAQVYICVNVAAGIGALALIREFDLFGPYGQGNHNAIYEVLLAGFGSVAFFRTSLFTARVGDTDIGIGPSTVLKALLDASDLAADRDQAHDRAEKIEEIMDGIAFDRVRVTLPLLCLSLVQGATQDQQKLLGEQVDKLITLKANPGDPPISDKDKAVILGVYLLRQVGAPVLKSALDILRQNDADDAAAKAVQAPAGPPAPG